MSNETLYAARDVIRQGYHYLKHVGAMTREGLESKSAIAAELAHRDIEIMRMTIRIADLERENTALKDAARAAGKTTPMFNDAEAMSMKSSSNLDDLTGCRTSEGESQPLETSNARALGMAYAREALLMLADRIEQCDGEAIDVDAAAARAIRAICVPQGPFAGQALAWIRLLPDGCYEGPVMASESRMQSILPKLSEWTPLGIISVDRAAVRPNNGHE